MKLTNKSNYPEALVIAIENDDYNKGACDFSITELDKPPRINVLQSRYGHEIQEDVEDGLYRLYGKIIHKILETANKSDTVEKRLFADFIVDDKKYVISGQLDSLTLDGGLLSDWKFTTAWKFKRGQVTDESWVYQLNGLLELLRRNGMDAKALQINGLIRDFSKPEARRNPDYPQSSVQSVPIEIWPREKTVEYIENRIRLHVAARISLPECSMEDRWADNDKWAVMKKGGKRAVKLHETEAAARLFVEQDPKNFYVEVRKGESKRCSMYCAVSKFCTQYQSTLIQIDEIEGAG